MVSHKGGNTLRTTGAPVDYIGTDLLNFESSVLESQEKDKFAYPLQDEIYRALDKSQWP